MQGTRIGAYEILRLIGHGATASVFEGRHVALGKPVAIKILHEHLAGDEQVAGRFLREGRIAARLRHPNALDVMDVGQENGAAYLVMALLEGHDLKAHLADRGVLTLDEAVAILLPIASALAHAHDIGAVHRDLKPANVFLSQDVRGGVVPMLVDFGLSKLEGVTDAKPLTGSDIVAGTVSYMAPEQTFGVANAGPAADQFSLAMILYECVTGGVPFAAGSFFDLIEQIRAALVKPPSMLAPSLPTDVDDVILRALAREPEKRWPTMRAFANALLPFADEETQQAWRNDFAAVPRAKHIASRPRVLTAHAAPLESETRVPASKPPPPIVPPLPMAAGSGPFHIKGLAYRGLALLAARLVPRGLVEIAEALEDPALTAFVDQPFLASGRYDLLPMYPLHAAVAEVLGCSLEELSERAAASQARYDARTVFQRMVGQVTLDDWPSCLRRFGAQYYDFGVLDGRTESAGVVVLHHSGVPEYVRPWFAPMQAAYGAEFARLLGARTVETELLPTKAGGTDRGLPVVTVSSRVQFTA